MGSKNLYRLVVGVLSASISSIAFSGEAELESRIKQLEEMLKTVQQQRAEQDKQLEILTKEIVGVESQLSQSKNAKTEEKGSSKGNPVYANNKDGLVFEDGTGKWSFQVNGRIQADYRNIDPQEWKNDSFSIRRARLGGTFNFLKDFAVRVEGEYSNTNDGNKSTTALTYGYLDWKHFQGVKVRIGQFKPIFGLERGESTNFTDFQELSLATATGASFNSTYDRGVMLFGSPIKGTYYNLSYVNGSGQNNDSMTNSKDIVGRIAINAAELANWNNSVIHFGLSGSHSNVQGSKPYSSTAIDRTLSAYTESNGLTSNSAGYTNTTATKFFSASAFDDDSIDKDRLGVETALSLGSLKFQGEYINTNFKGHSSTGANVDKDIDAWYASVTWLVNGESYSTAYKDGMFGRIRPNNDFDLNKGTWGAWELGIRYSSFDASDFNLASDGCGSGSGCLAPKTTSGGVTTSQYTNKADAWTAGAKWILNPNARIVLNYIRTNFDTPVIINSKVADHENAITMRAQYDF